MPVIVYDVPNWALGLGLVLAWVMLGLGAQAVLPRRWRERATEADRNVALASLGVIATINSLLLAFSAVSVWDSFSAAEQAVSREATAIAQLGRSLAVYGTPESTLARERLRGYGRSVIGKEWAAMQHEQPSQPTQDAFDDVYRSLGALRPASAAETVLVEQMWSQANDLLMQRRARLEASDGKVPTTLWVVVLVSSLLTLAPVSVLPVTACSRGAIVVLAIALGLVFHFVAAMDRPFLGAERVTSDPIENALANMLRWDSRSLPVAAR
ncbi:hypothetical protein [Roseateles noduli]|uniref:bestrophin-like domain n=1 Tax=Roseateles noduli TaxID=2052484 RepID=UPI003D657F06